MSFRIINITDFTSFLIKIIFLLQYPSRYKKPKNDLFLININKNFENYTKEKTHINNIFINSKYIEIKNFLRNPQKQINYPDFRKFRRL
jgi:hypothetical protein